MKSEFYPDFFTLVREYRAGKLTRSQLAAAWEKAQKAHGVTVCRRLLCLR
jgi:hypothetical protein